MRALKGGIAILFGLWGAGPTWAVQEPAPYACERQLQAELDGLTPEERFAWALVRILPDGMDSSLARLKDLLAGTLEADLRSRIEREQGRIEAWLRLRTAFLEKLADEQGLLGVSRAATQSKLRLRSFAQGQLLLEERSGQTRSVSAEGIDQLGLACQIPKGTFADDWARYYPYVLQGDSRWKKLLRDDGGAAGALLADARSDYPARVSVGSAVQHLLELLQGPPPTTAEEIDGQLESMRELLNESAELSLVQRNRDALLGRTREVLMQRYELLPLDQRLAGKLERLGEGRVRMSYSFEDQLELDDFDAGGSSAGVGFPTLTSVDEPFRVADNVLSARGHASMRTLFELGAPLVVNYEITYVQPEQPSSTTYFGLGLCDDGQGHFLWAVNLSLLQLIDLRRNAQVQGTDRLVFFNTPYDLQLHHDGDNLTLFRDRKELLSLGVGTRHCGAVFVQVHSDLQVQLDNLVIEGQLIPNTFDRLKQAWVEDEIQNF